MSWRRLPQLAVCCLLGAAIAVPTAAGSRSFRLGFTPFPPDVTEEAIDWTYGSIGEHADLIAHHFDNGVPWPEALAETGYAAEDVELGSIGIEVPGIGSWQKKYLKQLLADLEELDAEFLVWFVIGDYDRLWTLIEEAGGPEFVKAWRDTGMFDGDLERRPALGVWDRALRKPID